VAAVADAMGGGDVADGEDFITGTVEADDRGRGAGCFARIGRLAFGYPAYVD
jgi:hypothetical protein